MGGFWNRRFWMWVITVPAVILGALAAMGDTLEIAARLWWLSLPVLGALAFLIWRGLDPAEPSADPSGAGYLVFKLIATPILVLLCLLAFGLVVAFIAWLRPYWLIVGPVYGAFALFVTVDWVRDRLKARSAKRAQSV
ncbi:MAG TPA: hypothetical protein VMT68_16365 [Caulobacteraceae bacterium]|nr:hypothetical protein [Caulobacteraceae bacterium]